MTKNKHIYLYIVKQVKIGANGNLLGIKSQEQREIDKDLKHANRNVGKN